jgi:hypothetical protein
MDEQPLPERADGGADDATETPARKPPRPDPLSITSRRRLLTVLMTAAESGDVNAAAALVELGLSAERDAQIAAVLRRLKPEGEDAWWRAGPRPPRPARLERRPGSPPERPLCPQGRRRLPRQPKSRTPARRSAAPPARTTRRSNAPFCGTSWRCSPSSPAPKAPNSAAPRHSAF